MSRKDRIDDIKNELKALSGGDMTSWTSPDLPEHVAEQFWKDVLAFETAPTTTNFQQLTRAGVPFSLPKLIMPLVACTILSIAGQSRRGPDCP